MFGYIYKITNKINGKTYVGKKQGNFNEKYYGSGVAINDAIRKYGKDNFKIEVLEYCDTLELLNEREIHYISYTNPEYNIAKGGDGGYTLLNISEKERNKIITKRNKSLKRKWDSLSEDERKSWGESISRGKKGKSINSKNRIYTEELKRKISESNKKWWLISSPEKIKERKDKQLLSAERRKGIPNKKCWKKIEVDGITYDSMKEACDKVNVSFPTLKKWIKEGKAKYA